MIGIIAAMDAEVNEILKFIEVTKKEVIGFTECIYGTIQDKDVVVCKSGVGKGMASMATTILCLKNQLSAIINIGTAGGLKEEENVLDIVISDTIIQADYDTTPIDGEQGQGLYFQADETLKQACIQASQDCNISYHVGTIASQDLFMAREQDFKRVMSLFPCSICSEMEAGAIAQVASAFHVPFVIVRSLSDTIYHHENAMEFSQYVSLASHQSAKLVYTLIEDYL
ncbi:MAG: 5'-methylthioadenosine/adenosylhomocysteine nucleosidase [Floccifex sp.]